MTGILKLFGHREAEARHINAVIRAADSILAEFKRPAVLSSDNMGLARWLASDDTGMSSKYLAGVLAGGVSAPISEFAYPHDPSDFGRCYRMLRACPELRAKIAVMGTMKNPWPQLYAAWSELEQLYEAESPSGTAPKLYARMQQIIQSAGFRS